jgi:hypothetical protein
MADTKISDLPSKTAPEDNDLLPIVDMDVTVTKKVDFLAVYNYVESRLKGPEFTRDVDGNITQIDYDDGSYKVFTYTSGQLTQLDLHIAGYVPIKRKTFIYSGDTLIRIDETIV